MSETETKSGLFSQKKTSSIWGIVKLLDYLLKWIVIFYLIWYAPTILGALHV